MKMWLQCFPYGNNFTPAILGSYVIVVSFLLLRVSNCCNKKNWFGNRWVISYWSLNNFIIMLAGCFFPDWCIIAKTDSLRKKNQTMFTVLHCYQLTVCIYLWIFSILIFADYDFLECCKIAKIAKIDFLQKKKKLTCLQYYFALPANCPRYDHS